MSPRIIQGLIFYSHQSLKIPPMIPPRNAAAPAAKPPDESSFTFVVVLIINFSGVLFTTTDGNALSQYSQAMLFVTGAPQLGQLLNPV